ncbi:MULTISPECIES: erythromycin resistance leader peptide [Bacillaceae]
MTHAIRLRFPALNQ